MTEAQTPHGLRVEERQRKNPPDRTIVPGCTVYLRPGSPRMTVLAVKDDGTADVVLNLYGTLTMHRDNFPLLALDFVAGPKR